VNVGVTGNSFATWVAEFGLPGMVDHDRITAPVDEIDFRARDLRDARDGPRAPRFSTSALTSAVRARTVPLSSAVCGITLRALPA